MRMRRCSVRHALISTFAYIIALCLVVSAMPQIAQASCNFGTVSVSLPASATLVPGQSMTVSCTVSPASHAQTPNCTTDYCPSGCEANSGAGCLNADGQCTCYGASYSTYYSTVSVSSSNPSVARATYLGGALSISAYSPGTALITVYGDLRLWSTGSATITVTVDDTSVANPGDSPREPSAGAGTGGASGSGAVGGSVSVSDAGVSASSSTGRVLSALVAQGDPAKIQEGVENPDEGEVSLVRLGDVPVAEALASVAGTKNTVCFWKGESIELADYLWSFAGTDLAPEAVTDVDLDVQDGADSHEQLVEALSDTTYLVLDFAHEGAYPCAAMFGYRVADTFPNGERLTLYFYDERSDALVLVQKGIEVAEGYATFKMDHGSTWVLAKDANLEGSLAGESVQSSDMQYQAALGQEKSTETPSVLIWPIVISALAVVLVVLGIVLLRRRVASRSGYASTGENTLTADATIHDAEVDAGNEEKR